jgi:hypothetical protein
MLRKFVLLCGALALVATIALAASLGIGKAASTNTCNPVVNNQTNCFSVTVDPVFVTSGQTGLINAKFKNTFGSANASHTAISLAIPAGLSNLIITTFGRATCSTPLQTGVAQTLTCSYGNVPNGATVQMRVQFTSSVPVDSSIAVSGTLTFAEGNGTNTNDSFTVTGSALSVSGTTKAGYCTTSAKKFVKNKQVPLVTTTDSSGQTTTIESLQALANLPCTPIAAAVDDPPANPGPGIPTTHISTVAFQATGTVTLLFPLSELNGRDASTFQLLELSIVDGATWLAVNRCTDNPPIAPGTDTCIISQTNVKINSTNYVQDVLNVEGQPPDGRYGG